MHIEVLVEDSSGARLLTILLPKLLGEPGQQHTWRVHSYKGVGRIPKNLKPGSDSQKRILLDQLPRLLQGYGKNQGVDLVLVVVDTDDRDCKAFLADLETMLASCKPSPKTMFRLAIEEIEAWYLGDEEALRAAYPRAKMKVLENYVQDSVCGTWELLAEVVHPGGAKALKDGGWQAAGTLKHKWAEEIGPLLDPDRNQSPSFGKLRDGLRRVCAVDT